jgi:hypothetical protein
MSHLETSVKEMLGPMIRNGRATRLARFEQKMFAMWAIETAMMLNLPLSGQERVIPDTQRCGCSVDRSGLRDPDALDPESAAERLEVAIVVKDRIAALGRGRRDHVVGGGQPALATQLA